MSRFDPFYVPLHCLCSQTDYETVKKGHTIHQFTSFSCKQIDTLYPRPRRDVIRAPTHREICLKMLLETKTSSRGALHDYRKSTRDLQQSASYCSHLSTFLASQCSLLFQITVGVHKSQVPCNPAPAFPAACINGPHSRPISQNTAPCWRVVGARPLQ